MTYQHLRHYSHYKIQHKISQLRMRSTFKIFTLQNTNKHFMLIQETLSTKLNIRMTYQHFKISQRMTYQHLRLYSHYKIHKHFTTQNDLSTFSILQINISQLRMTDQIRLYYYKIQHISQLRRLINI